MSTPPPFLQVVGFRVQGSGCRVQGSGFRVQGPGLVAPDIAEGQDDSSADFVLPHEGHPSAILVPVPNLLIGSLLVTLTVCSNFHCVFSFIRMHQFVWCPGISPCAPLDMIRASVFLGNPELEPEISDPKPKSATPQLQPSNHEAELLPLLLCHKVGANCGSA
jgi:hypothetical protein